MLGRLCLWNNIRRGGKPRQQQDGDAVFSTILPLQTQEFAQGAAVFDLSDPDRLGKIIIAGPQQSEVKFDDGAVRIVPNVHLGAVGVEPEVDNAVSIDKASIATNPALAEHARAIRELVTRTREGIIAIGRHLAEARNHVVAHGAWLDWIDVEFGWSDQTARRFIHVYDLSRDAKFNTLVELDLPLGALYQLAAPKSAEARQEIADRLKAGEQITRAAVNEAIAHQKAANSAAEPETAAVEDAADSEADDGDDQGDEPQEDSSWLLRQAWELATPKDRVEFIQSKPVAEFIQSRPIDRLLALLSDDQRTALERRSDDQRAAAAKPEIDANVLKALRQALSLQQAAKRKDSTAIGVANALNSILNMLRGAGLDLSAVDVVIRKATKRPA